MPNTSSLAAQAIAAAMGATGVWASILEAVLDFFLQKAAKQTLIIADEAQVAIVVHHDGSAWSDSMDHAYAIVDQGKELTQEEKDAIDQPVMDAFHKLSTFSVRQSTTNT